MDCKELLARTLWAEARGESFKGKLAVASVIWNRAKGDPSNFFTVCLKPKQFSCWNDGTLHLRKIDVQSPVWQECYKIASDMASLQFTPSIDATHYHAVSVKPYWIKGMKFRCKIGNHMFYKGV